MSIGGYLKGLLKSVGMMAAGAAALLAISLLFDEPLQTFFLLLSLAGTAMLLLSVVGMLLTFRQARTLDTTSLLMALAVALLSALFSLMMAAELPSAVSTSSALLAGTGLGYAWSRTTLLFIDGDAVRARGTAWYLIVWAISFGATQILSALAGEIPTAAVLAMMFSTGLALGNTIGLLIRLQRATLLRAGGA